MDRWKHSFYLYMLASSTAFGIYIVVSRDIAYNRLEDQYQFVMLLVALENIPSIFSVAAGGLGDVIGRRKLVMIGALSSLPLLLMGYLPVNLLPLLAGAFITLWTIGSPSVTGALLDATSSSGLQYSFYAMFGSIGWGIGGLLGGVLLGLGSKSIPFTVASIVILLGFLTAYAFYPSNAVGKSASFRDVGNGIQKVFWIFITITLLFMGVTMLYGSFAIKLRGIVGSPELFGLVYTALPAITGSIVRPFSGILSDKIKPVKMLMMVITGYLVIFPLLAISTGYVAVALWLIPLYPLMDQASMMAISRKLPNRLQGVAAGIWNTAYSLAGLLVLLVTNIVIPKDIWIVMAISTLSLLISILTIAIYYKKSRENLINNF